jgi:hypothetical protein
VDTYLLREGGNRKSIWDGRTLTIKQLEGALGRKTLENEILKEAVDFAKAKKWIARSPVLPGGEQ